MDKTIHDSPLGAGFAHKDTKAAEEFEPEYFESTCCSASPLGEMHESFHLDEYWGLCSTCKDHADFEAIDIYGQTKSEWQKSKNGR
tara:strand:+ start:293 stop:550 length:258 start_codon:yes stop_codon:yes gene_type:complete